ncbi:cytochrome P450 [Basidiobolus meristosporus CBS 931.73]|uniref:Cytochrome P450 n=1 Tax=Basidiobolus meristosporus CBS 931.73 TaxID=1314790 RepID=A0A1Y1WRM6_9FUNG|nr:cytochrome P450 [Basidiobolus meristosporus CBS 931.73]|eukprot:ORX75916.1 cytochrome P450 [Basidiobolus meristosporus CBS 931.73]
MLGGMEMADIIEKYFIPKLREHGIARTYIKGVSGVMVSKLEYFKQIYRDTATFPKVPLTSVKYSLNYKFVGANIIFTHEPGNHRFNDLLSVLVKAWSEKQLSFDEMLNEAVVLSIAGHDTTASSLSSVIYVLAKYPAIQEKVREEVNRVLKSHASTEDIPSTAEIKMLHYLEATIKESMRLYPPAPILPTRMAACDTMLGQIPIPKGSLITLNIYALQRDEQYWENPTMVDPERWLNSGGQVQDLPAWCPFTNGSRLCIGKSFAMNEMKIVLSMLGKCSSLKA